MAKKKPTDPAPAKRPCFVCNGTGSFCDLCGEAVNVCDCEDDGGGSVHDCEDCRGTGIAAASAFQVETDGGPRMSERCTECGRQFDASPDEFGDVSDVCPACVLDAVRDAAPELLGDEDYPALDAGELFP